MKVLLVGGGGREHALAWKIAQSPLLTELIAAPGNPGIAALGTCVKTAADDIDGLVSLAQQREVDLVVVGPEAPLAAGLVDRLIKLGIPAFGPTAHGAQIESSKAYAKELMARHNIPTARHASFTSYENAIAYVDRHPLPMVIKADGLAAGKGVVVAESYEQAREAVERMMRGGVFGQAGSKLVIEEFLEGEEASMLALVDGRTICPLESSQDHKRLGDGDSGPNTGGMGAYSPAPVVTPAIYERIERDILLPTVHALQSHVEDGHEPYRGLLYVGLMLTDTGPMVVEYNCRFGDPETQAVLMRLDSDLLPLLLATAQGRLESAVDNLRWSPDPAVCLVLASGGYPGSYEKGKAIHGLDDAPEGSPLATGEAQVFHAGTARTPEGNLMTHGGRVLSVTARGKTLQAAKDAAYKAAWRITFEGKTFRSDIADRGIAHLNRFTAERIPERKG